MNESLELPRQIRKFNPGTLQSDEEVIRQFVVRKPKLGIVLEVLRGNIDSPSCQHVLLVAPRGRGEIHVARTYRRRTSLQPRTFRAIAAGSVHGREPGDLRYDRFLARIAVLPREEKARCAIPNSRRNCKMYTPT